MFHTISDESRSQWANYVDKNFCSHLTAQKMKPKGIRHYIWSSTYPIDLVSTFQLTEETADYLHIIDEWRSTIL